MTIDERLDRLTERHEALTQSIELQMLDTRENTRNIATLSLVVRELSRNIQATNETASETLRTVSETTKTVSETLKLVNETLETVNETNKTVGQMAASIATLGRLAEMHEHRLDRIEGEQP